MNPLHVRHPAAELSGPLQPHQKVTTIVGEPLQLEIDVAGVTTLTWSLLRQPAASKAKLDGRRLLTDQPGLYVLRLTTRDGWHRDVTIAAFPKEALGRTGFGPLPGPREPDPSALHRRLRLKNIVNDARVTPERIAAMLEPPGDPEGCLGLGGGLLGEQALNPQSYGGFVL
jgi:hypothetical protein